MLDAVSFTTFLKICLQVSTTAKLREVDRLYGSEGGYDFYRMLKRVPYDFATGQLKAGQIAGFMASITRQAERNHNTQMAIAFSNWWNALGNPTDIEVPPPRKFKPKGHDFKIRIAPELAYKLNGQRSVVYLWAVAKPALTNQVAGSGLLLLRQALDGTKYKNYQKQILDLRKGKLFDESFITNQSPIILSADLAAFEAIKVSLGH